MTNDESLIISELRLRRICIVMWHGPKIPGNLIARRWRSGRRTDQMFYRPHTPVVPMDDLSCLQPPPPAAQARGPSSEQIGFGVWAPPPDAHISDNDNCGWMGRRYKKISKIRAMISFQAKHEPRVLLHGRNPKNFKRPFRNTSHDSKPCLLKRVLLATATDVRTGHQTKVCAGHRYSAQARSGHDTQV